MSKNRVAIQDSYDLPSRGLCYPEGTVPASVTIRAMNALDEKMRLSSNSGISIIPKLINSCVVEPKEFHAEDLKLFDLQYLMYALRMVTYGPEYTIEIRCPHCNATKEIKVNLADIPVTYVDDGFKEPFDIGPLPVSDDIIHCRIQTSRDLADIAREARRIKSKFPNYVGDPEYLLDVEACIVGINDKELKKFEIQKYVENMHARDLQFFRREYSKVVDELGMDLNMIEICDECGEDIEFSLPITEEFFRPKY